MYSPSQWMTWSFGPRISAVHLPPSRTSIAISSVEMAYCSPPYQSAKRSGSVHSRQTSSRGASKVQIISMSGLRSAIAVLQAAPHSIEATLPEAAVALDPLGRLLERSAGDPGRAELGRLAAGDQASAFKDLEVLGDRLDADREGLGELSDRRLSRRQSFEDRAPRGVGECCEGAVELARRHRPGI